MHSEADLRFIERTHPTSQPYGYGCLPIRPLGGSPQAESRPQLTQSDPEGNGPPKSDTRKALELLDEWDRFVEWFRQIPGFWRSILGLLAAPLKWLGWVAVRPVAWIGVAVVLVFLLATIPLIYSSGHREPRRGEATQLMGSARDFCRVAYSKTGKAEDAAREFEAEVQRGAFDGEYFEMSSRLEVIDGKWARLRVRAVHPKETDGYIEFEWSSGNSDIKFEKTRSRR